MGRRVLRGVCDMVLVASVLVLVALGVGPRLGHYRTLNVLSSSMRPAMPAGSLVIVTREPLQSVRPGQVITYTVPEETPEVVVTHRVVERYGPADAPVVRTKGDANPAPDPWLAHLEGNAWRVRYVIPHLGLMLETVRHARWRPIVVDLVPFLVALMWIVHIWRRPLASTPAVEPVTVARGNSWHDSDESMVVTTPAARVDIPAGVVTAVMCEDDGSVFVAVVHTLTDGDGASVTVGDEVSFVPSAHVAHIDGRGKLRGIDEVSPYELLADAWIGQNIDDRLAARIVQPLTQQQLLQSRELVGVA